MRYAELAELHPGDSSTRSEQLSTRVAAAAAALDSNRPDEAQRALGDAMRWNPASRRVWRLWAELHRLRGDTVGRRAALQCAVELSDDDDETSAGLAELDELTGETHNRCDACGQVGVLGSARYCSVRGRRMCPRCHTELRHHKAGRSALLYKIGILVLLGLGPLGLLLGGGPLAVAMTNYLIFVLFLFALIPLHELAHAATAIALGGRVMRVQLGCGPRLARLHWRDIPIWLHRDLIVGATVLGFPRPKWIRLRRFLAIAAGPLVHLVFSAVLIRSSDWGAFGQGVGWRTPLLWANVVILFLVLVPRRMRSSALGVPNDGMNLWRILRGHNTALEIHASYFAAATAVAAEDHRLDRASAVIEEGLNAFPDSPTLLTNHAILLIRRGRYEEALPLLEEQLTRHDALFNDPAIDKIPDESRFFRLLIVNAIAYALALIENTPEDNARALDLAAECQRQAPWFPAFGSTLGTVLVAAGHPAAGLMYCEHAVRHPGDRQNGSGPEDLASAALALHRLGRFAQARRRLNAARAGACEERLLEQVSAEVEFDPGVRHLG